MVLFLLNGVCLGGILVRKLVDRGAEPLPEVLNLAAKRGLNNVVEFLVQAGARADPGSLGELIFDWAALRDAGNALSSSVRKQLVTLLVKSRASIEKTQGADFAPLQPPPRLAIQPWRLI